MYIFEMKSYEKVNVKHQEVVLHYAILKKKCISFVFLHIMKHKSTIDTAIDAFYKHYNLSYTDYDPETFKRLIGREKEKMKKEVGF